MKKQFKYLRFKTKNPQGFKTLNKSPIFSLLFNSKEYEFLLAESLILLIRDLNNADELETYDVERKFNRFIKRLKSEEELYEDIDVPTFIKISIINEIINIFNIPNELSKFKGNILEYYIIYIQKYTFKRWKKSELSNQFRIRHEPIISYKRRSIFKDAFDGDKCDVDVVRVEKFGEYIHLIECKFNLDGNIIGLKNNQKKIKKKMTYMSKVDETLSKYNNFYDTNISVVKMLASFTSITEDLPEEYSDFELLNIQEEFKEMLKLVPRVNM